MSRFMAQGAAGAENIPMPACTLGLANDRSVHAVGKEPAGTIALRLNNVEHLRGRSRDTQSIGSGDVVGSL